MSKYSLLANWEVYIFEMCIILWVVMFLSMKPFYFFYRISEESMWISAEQLGPVLKHHWFTTKFTESTLNYALYHNRNNVKVYTLRFNLKSPNYSHENMVDEMINKVMKTFPKTESLICNFQYDMLLVNNKEDEPSYYLWRANSNQLADSSTEEILLKKDYHQLYFFGQRATETNMSELNFQFESSAVVVADVLTIVFTFTSAGTGRPQKTTKGKGANLKKKKATSYQLTSPSASIKERKHMEKPPNDQSTSRQENEETPGESPGKETSINKED
jgi:hypothetical protein